MTPSQIRNIILIVLLVLLLSGSHAIAEFIIEYNWWKEIEQVETWFTMLLYQILPAVLASLVAFAVAMWAHSRGCAFAGAPVSRYPLYSKLSAAILFVVAVVFLGSGIDSTAIMAYVGALGIEMPADAWKDPVFGNGLPFYLFSLPFYGVLLRYVFTLAILSIVIFWATGRGWQIFERLQQFRQAGGSMEEFDPGPNPLLLEGATRTSFARILASLGLLAFAIWFFLGQYSLLLNTHAFMTGMDYVDELVSLRLRWIVILALLAAIPLIWGSRFKTALGVVAASLVANAMVPSVVRAVWVRPNELELERPYIERHIETTNEAFNLVGRSRVETFEAAVDDTIDVRAHATLIDNIRLWDWRAFKDTITQIQALRPYYEFADIDVDRYTIDGKIKQVLLSPREININQLPPQARESWINEHFFYTHGYGVVMSEVNRTTADGLPVLLIQDAPPEIRVPDIQLERPEIYFGDVTQEPVFVNTEQEEFDYPSGDQNITSSYEGSGGIPIHSLFMRLAAAVRYADANILLTGVTQQGSTMMIHRNVSARLDHLTDFLYWDPDPYLTITSDGRLVWIVDGYTASDRHPYSVSVGVGQFNRRINYVRNSIKATVDAYDGATRLYVNDPEDPILQAYRNLFPHLFHDMDEMPESVRAHLRYPELMFQIQAEVFRTFHMRDPDVFYNKEDMWDIAQSLSGDTGRSAPMAPTYVVATLPDEDEPEFILMLPFTPRNKDNLIGWMAARCDGERLGELIFYQLSKQELIFGPNQIESRINQNENIARDLTLWNQQGSRVLRGDILALPVGDNFLYVESIYIQAESARMPQLRKVVLALGEKLVYENTFEEALLQLSAQERLPPGREMPEPTEPVSGEAPVSEARPPAADRKLSHIAERLRELRRQAEQLVTDLQSVERELQE